MQPSNAPTGPLSLGDILDRTFRLYRAHLGNLLTMGSVLMLPVAVLALIINILAPGAPVPIQQLQTGEPIMDGYLQFVSLLSGSTQVSPLAFIYQLLGGIMSMLLTLGLIVYVLDVLGGASPAVGASIRTGRSFFWRYFGLSFLIGLAMVGLALLMVISAFVPLLLCITVPVALGGIFYLAARWYVAHIALVNQETGVTEALSVSWRLTYGFVWRTIGYSLLLLILGQIIGNIPTILVLTAQAILPDFSGSGLAAGLTTASSYLIAIIWTPISITAVTLYYLDLRVRKDDYDLALRLVDLEASAYEAEKAAVASLTRDQPAQDDA